MYIPVPKVNVPALSHSPLIQILIVQKCRPGRTWSSARVNKCALNIMPARKVGRRGALFTIFGHTALLKRVRKKKRRQQPWYGKRHEQDHPYEGVEYCPTETHKRRGFHVSMPLTHTRTNTHPPTRYTLPLFYPLLILFSFPLIFFSSHVAAFHQNLKSDMYTQRPSLYLPAHALHRPLQRRATAQI